jgi:hypothetical protein
MIPSECAPPRDSNADDFRRDGRDGKCYVPSTIHKSPGRLLGTSQRAKTAPLRGDAQWKQDEENEGGSLSGDRLTSGVGIAEGLSLPHNPGALVSRLIRKLKNLAKSSGSVRSGFQFLTYCQLHRADDITAALVERDDRLAAISKSCTRQAHQDVRYGGNMLLGFLMNAGGQRRNTGYSIRECERK